PETSRSSALRAIHAVQRGALTRCEYARRGEGRVRLLVEKRVRPTEAAHPPAEQLQHAERNEPERERRGRVRRQRADGGALKYPTERRAECLVAATLVGIVIHKAMNEADHREARPGRVADRRPATIRVPAIDVFGEVKTAHGVGARRKLQAADRHLENIRSA